MANHWYRFWIKYCGPGGGEETYRYYANESSEDVVHSDAEEWADETETDDGHYGYRNGYEAVEVPPLDWLRGRVGGARRVLVYKYGKLHELADELRRLEGSIESGPELKRRQDEIPNLPKKEVPESGYRAIYDWVLTNVHPDLLLNGTKTASELVIEILEKAFRRAKQ